MPVSKLLVPLDTEPFRALYVIREPQGEGILVYYWQRGGNPMGRWARIRKWIVGLGAFLVLAAIASVVFAQGGGWWNRVPPRFAEPNTPSLDQFAFCRVLYESVRGEPSGYGWNTDYPYSDINFMTRFSQLTTGRIRRDGDGMPEHVVVTLMDDTIYEYPFVFMSDVGTVGFSPMEAERLRDYLLRGGVLYVDDFWGERAWDQWKRELEKVLPPDAYPIVDVPLDNTIFRTFYTIREVPQIPSIHFWRRSGGSSTSERGLETAVPHFRGIFDEQGRLMVIMTHNTDIADGWEREAEEEEYFYRFSLKAYPVGINIALYAMTH